jgi:replicative DNA helicase
MTLLQDKQAILHVFAGLLANPHHLKQSSNFNLSVDDFPEKLHQIVFSAFSNLYDQEVERITPIEIDGYLSKFPIQYSTLNSNGGIEYLYKLEEIGEPDNYEYHYNRIKKFSFLRACKAVGINVSDIYDETVVDLKDSEKQQYSFDTMTLRDMIRHVDEKLLDVKEMFREGGGEHSQKMSDNISETLEEMMKTPTYGLGLASSYVTAITRGARKTKYYLRSSITGGGKSRYALADLLTLCVPKIWDLDNNQWVLTGMNANGLFQTTELSVDEIQIPCLAFISGVPEWKILDGNLTDGEQSRLREAVKILEETNLWIEHLNDFDIQQIEESIERHVIKYGVEYVIFDYIHSSMRVLGEMSKATGIKMAEHQILLLISDKIKQIANKYNVWILSGTQLNNEYKTDGNLDSSALAGAKAISNKVDVGMIMLPLDKKDEKIIEEIKRNNASVGFGDEPSHSITFYKNRRGEFNFVRVWLKIDLGNLRTKDLFVTDMNGNLISNITPKKVVLKPVPKQETISDSLPTSFDF